MEKTAGFLSFTPKTFYLLSLKPNCWPSQLVIDDDEYSIIKRNDKDGYYINIIYSGGVDID